jgi:tetratricopeptide (TPR) repeat protein
MTRSSVYLLALLAALLVAACSQNDNAKTAKAALSAAAPQAAELLDRNASIRNGKEWDDVQNIYAAQLKALSANADDHEARLKLSEVFINEARVTGEHPHYYPAALAMVAPVVTALSGKATLSPQEKDHLFRALSNQASVQLSLHDFAAALETAQKAVAINPYNAQIYGALVDANVELGRYAQAVEMADKMVGIRPDLRSYSRVSYLREIHGDVPGAVAALDMAIKAGFPGQESTAWTRLTLGNLHKTYGDWKKAEEQYRLILEERTDYPFALAALGEVEMHRKNYSEAEKLLKKACDIIPEVGYYESLAELYKATGRTAEFDALIPEIEQMMAEDTEKGHNMSLEYAALYTDLKPDYAKALQYAQGEYAKRPDNIDVNRLLARIYALQQNTGQAREHLTKASATHSKHPDISEVKKMLGT